MFKIIETKIYRRDIKLQASRNKDLQKIFDALKLLLKNSNEGVKPSQLLPEQYKLHKLKGNYNGLWECHIESDWLLIFDIDYHAITLERTGTHSDLFNKIRR